MRVRFWGTRGSIPSPGPDTVRYGGNTPCVTVASDTGAPLIFDAGTGIRALGAELESSAPDEQLDIFLTHTHWDHIQGLPFFAPLFRRGARIRIWGADDPPGTLSRTIRALMVPDVFPVRFENAGAIVDFRGPPFEGVTLNGLTVRSFAVHHPGGALAYRIELADGPCVVYVPDNELHDDGQPQSASVHDGLREACRGATLLIHDSTYTTAESGDFMGWGHSTTDEALELALESGVEMLALFHHAPDRPDADVDAMVARCQDRAGSALRVFGAAEGMEVVVGHGE